jgi:FdhD protein
MTQPRRRATDWPVLAVSREGRIGTRPDFLVTEEPMEVRVAVSGRPAETISVTMRTPGHDFELAVGFLFTEGIIVQPGDLRTVKYCELDDAAEQLYNIVTVEIAKPFAGALARRAMVTSASCGICGTESIDQLLTCTTPVSSNEGPVLSAEVLLGVAEAVRKSQPTFDRTGGLHASALFNERGEITLVREDIGRHNAVDKVIGHEVMNKRVPLTGSGLFCSGRLSFEIIQKAAMARIAMIAAVGAPSSLAVETADKLGITIVGFLRDGKANIYTHPHRLLS